MKKWNELSMADRAKYIKLGVEQGITDINHISSAYNSYAEGVGLEGFSEDNPMELPELEVWPRTMTLTTWRPGDNPYPFTGHSKLSIRDYNPDSVASRLDIDKTMDSKDYDLVLNNCSDATRRVLEGFYNKKMNPLLFTTPGDTRDFLIENSGKNEDKNHKITVSLTGDEYDHLYSLMANERAVDYKKPETYRKRMAERLTDNNDHIAKTAVDRWKFIQRIKQQFRDAYGGLDEFYDVYGKHYADGGDLNSWKKELSELWEEDLSTHGYDYDAYYNANPTEANIQLQRLKRGLRTHFPDTYKLPNHPTFSDESIYSNERTPGGKWHENYGNSGRWVYEPSEYTKANIENTKEYLRGSGEGYLDGMNVVFPSQRITPTEANRFDTGGSKPSAMERIASIIASDPRFANVNVDAALANYEDSVRERNAVQLPEVTVTATKPKPKEITYREINPYISYGDAVRINAESSPINRTLNYGARNFEHTFGVSPREVGDWLPYIGDALAVDDITKDINKGNYGSAAIGAGLLALPNFIEKPVKKVGRWVKNIFDKPVINQEVTDKLLKAVENYKSLPKSGYNITDLKRQLKKEGVDISKLSNSDLARLQYAREQSFISNIPEEQRVSIVRNANKKEGDVILLDKDGELGHLDLSDYTTDPGLDIAFIRNYRSTRKNPVHKVGEDLYNSGIVFSNSIGRKGIVSGTHLLSPEKTIKTMEHFPNKTLISNKGEYEFNRGLNTTYNNPIYRLETPGERPVVPTRNMSIFSSDIIDENGFFIPNYISDRLDYENGGKINRFDEGGQKTVLGSFKDSLIPVPMDEFIRNNYGYRPYRLSKEIEDTVPVRKKK